MLKGSLITVRGNTCIKNDALDLHIELLVSELHVEAFLTLWSQLQTQNIITPPRACLLTLQQSKESFLEFKYGNLHAALIFFDELKKSQEGLAD